MDRLIKKITVFIENKTLDSILTFSEKLYLGERINSFKTVIIPSGKGSYCYVFGGKSSNIDVILSGKTQDGEINISVSTALARVSNTTVIGEYHLDATLQGVDNRLLHVIIYDSPKSG